MAENKGDVIDLSEIWFELLKHKKVYIKTLPIVFVLSTLLIICVPRSYVTSTSLAPELGGSMTGDLLGSVASSFGLDFSQGGTNDAITPLLYPDLMEDNGFVAGLLSIRVKSEDGEIDCSYAEYLEKHTKRPWWKTLTRAIGRLFKFKKDRHGSGGESNPYYLSMKDDAIMKGVRKNIALSVDKKTGVITITTEAQDALICKTLADSATVHLQRFITEYRTNKARIDLEYYRGLMREAKEEYEKSCTAYGAYSDANTDVILESSRLKQNYLENEMQLRFNTYSTIDAQLQAALAKVQERTPAFTTIKGADVPIKPTKPRRMLFVIAMLLLAGVADSVYILRERLVKVSR